MTKQRYFLLFIVVFLCLGIVQFGYSATLGYGFTRVEGVRTNGVHIRAVYQSDTNIVLDTVSYHHPFYGDGYFHLSRSGVLPAGKYDVHFEYGNYFRNKTINYDPEIGPVNMGNVDLVRVEYYSDDTIIVLRNSQMEVVFKRQNGIIRGLTVKGHSGLLSLTQPGQIILRDTLIANEYQQNNGTVTDIDTNITSNLVRVVFEVNFPYHKAIINYTMDTLTLRWDNEVWLQNVSPSNDRALRLDFSLPLLDKMNYLFWANENAPLRIGDSLYKTIAYRHNWCILPVVILYDTTLDYGLSFVCPFEVKKPALSFRLIKNPSVDTFRISYNYLRMGTQNSRHAQASLYIVPHEGDWRPGLAWMRNRYPEYFDVNPNSNTLENEGRFFMSGSWTFGEFPKIDTCEIFKVKWTEYYSKPFFGLYAPQDRAQWRVVGDNETGLTYSQWLRDTINHPNTSYAGTRRMIDSFYVHGVGTYPYFNASEVWKAWVATSGDTFPFDSFLTKYANGDTITGFKQCWTMNPDTNLYPTIQHSWAVHIDSQCIAVLDSYCVRPSPATEAAGIFLDRDDYQAYDYAHNDSVSMINTTPVYMLGFALEEINEKICREVHNRNKSIMTNGPSGIEVCKNMDAIMSENYIPPLGSAQYLGLSRPMVLMVADKRAKETELKDKSALYTGYFPSFERIIDNPQERLKSRFIDRKYNPLFELYRGREWVLYPHALRLPVGIKGNIFKALNDDLLIPMVSMEKSQLLPDPFVYNLKVNISVPDLNQYDHCYILSGDYVGPRWIFYYPSNQEFLTLPEHMVSSLIQLSKDPRYEYSLMTLPVQVRGRQGHFRIRVQNLEAGTKQYSLLLKTPFGNKNYNFKLDSLAVKEIQYDFNISVSHLLKEDSFLVINTAPTPYDTVLFTNWIVDPVSFGLPEKLFIKFPIGDSFNLIVVNNTVDTMEQVRLGYEFIQGHGKMEWEPKSFRINPFETKKIPIEIDVRDTCGIIKIFATSN
ncbi:MAG: hypothetical protein ABIL66_05545, partial [candidate division WOR-3 bacterium]